MIIIILNYIVRGLIIAMGVLLISGIFTFGEMLDPGNTKLMGGLFILWGVYRILMYHIKLKHYSNWRRDDDEE